MGFQRCRLVGLRQVYRVSLVMRSMLPRKRHRLANHEKHWSHRLKETKLGETVKEAVRWREKREFAKEKTAMKVKSEEKEKSVRDKRIEEKR